MLVQADARLLPIADASVQCVITSPPYWGLRDYGTATWQGGDPTCAHLVGNQVQDSKAPGAIVAGVHPRHGCLHLPPLRCPPPRRPTRLGTDP